MPFPTGASPARFIRATAAHPEPGQTKTSCAAGTLRCGVQASVRFVAGLAEVEDDEPPPPDDPHAESARPDTHTTREKDAAYPSYDSTRPRHTSAIGPRFGSSPYVSNPPIVWKWSWFGPWKSPDPVISNPCSVQYAWSNSTCSRVCSA